MTLYEAHSPQTKQGRVRADGHSPSVADESDTLPPDPHHAQDTVAVAEWLADADKRRAMGIGIAPATHATEPLVKPERVTAIKAFRRSLTLLCEAYGVILKADTDRSGDILIVDTTRQIPSGYYYDGRITPAGELEIAEWVLDEEEGATNQ